MDHGTSPDEKLKLDDDGEEIVTEQAIVNEDTDTVKNHKQEVSTTLQPVISNVVQILHESMQRSWGNALCQITHKYECPLSEYESVLTEQTNWTPLDSNKKAQSLIQELHETKNRVKETQKNLHTLQSEHNFLTEKLNVYRLVTTEFRRELLSERLAHIDSVKETDELRAMLNGTGTDTLVNKHEDVNDPWHKTSGQIDDRNHEHGSNVSLFTSFYSTSAETNEQEFGDEENMSCTLSAQRSLQSTLMDQFLPSTLLDSPQAATQSKKFQCVDEEIKEVEEDSSRILDCKGCSNMYFTTDTKCHDCGKDVAPSTEEIPHESETETQENEKETSISTTISSILTEIFDFMPMQDVEKVLQQAEGETSLAVNYILRNHPSLNPSISTDLHTQRPNLARCLSGNPLTSASNNWKTELCVYYLQGKCNKTRRTCSFAHGEEDLMRLNRGKLLTNPAYKARLCPLFIEGNCPKSRRDCQLAHGEADLREGLLLLTAPSSLVNAAPRQQNYKTELCLFYLRGNCNYAKQECRFAHGEADIRTVQDNTLELIQRNASYPTSAVPEKASEKSAETSSYNLRGLDRAAIQAQHRYQQQYQEQYQQSRRLPPQTVEGGRNVYLTSQSFTAPQSTMNTSALVPPSFPHHPQYQVPMESMHGFPIQYTSQQSNTPNRFMQQGGIYQHHEVPLHPTQQFQQQLSLPNSQVSGQSRDPRTPQNPRYSALNPAFRRSTNHDQGSWST